MSVSQSVYAWFAIFVLPINSALNPILYTMTTVLFKQKVLAPLGIVRAQRKKGYITGTSVDETSSGVSKTSGTRLSIISTKSRGGSWNGRLSSHKVSVSVIVLCLIGRYVCPLFICFLNTLK